MFHLEGSSLEVVVYVVRSFRAECFGHVALRVEVNGQGSEPFFCVVCCEVNGRSGFGDPPFLVDDGNGFHRCVSRCVESGIKVVKISVRGVFVRGGQILGEHSADCYTQRLSRFGGVGERSRGGKVSEVGILGVWE